METGNNTNMEKVGQESLTKKERRALKVQAKLGQDNKTMNVHMNKESPIIKEKILPKQDKIVSPKGNLLNDNKDQSPAKQLSEKELRKLEWEKKLAEQKVRDNTKEGKETLSKAELKAKRREQQEAQRLAKASPKSNDSKTEAIKSVEDVQGILKEEPKKFKKSPMKKEHKKISSTHRMQLVQHLYDENSSKPEYNTILPNEIHPAFIRLGVQYSNKHILGSNARCLAMLAALRYLVNDLETPPKQDFCRFLENVLQSCTNYLHSCRPLAVSMTNALRHFKLQLTQIDTNLRDNEKRGILHDVIDTYINDEIKKAGEAISIKVNEKICNGDVILTYGCSSLIGKILHEAHKDGKKFEVIVIDGRPLLEGREMIRRLVVSGIKCTYVLINAISYMMKNVTKVILGAHALLTNGYVMSRTGTAQVALVARAYNKPVLVCCETYKFSERVQTDSIVMNELGDHETLSLAHLAMDNKEDIKVTNPKNKLPILNLMYDVTPPDLVTAVVTELAILPCTSVPAVLRINLPK